MNKNQKLLIGVLSSFLVVVLVVLSLVSSADPIASGPDLVCAPNTWVKRADFGGVGRIHSIAFSIKDKAYIGTGTTGGAVKDLWEYNSYTNSWTQKADFGGGERTYAIGFAIGTKGYVGTGWAKNTYFKDFWEYDPILNLWTQKADFGGVKRSRAVGFSIGDKGYIGTGGNLTTSPKDFWEYDPATDSWVEKKNYGGESRTSAVGFSIGDKGYIGTGWSSNGGLMLKDFWEFDPAGDLATGLGSWTQKADFGGGVRYQAVGFSVNNKGYIGTGSNAINYTQYQKDFWEYDPILNLWTQKANFGGSARNRAVGFTSIGNKGYIGLGGLGNNYYKDIWMYCPSQTIN